MSEQSYSDEHEEAAHRADVQRRIALMAEIIPRARALLAALPRCMDEDTVGELATYFYEPDALAFCDEHHRDDTDVRMEHAAPATALARLLDELEGA